MLKTHITLVVFVFNLLALGQSQLTIDQDGYSGCYVKSPIVHEFNSYVSHIDYSSLTPSLCRASCVALGYAMAAIENGTMCFCKSSYSIVSTQTSDSQCQVASCPGDSTKACGSTSTYMVYMAFPPSQVSLGPYFLVNLTNTKSFFLFLI
jgi:hypothetical protein